MLPQMQAFKEKIVLITGAASGFGKLLAEKLSAAGAKLALGDRNLEGLDAVRRRLPGDAIGLACDVSAEAQVANLVEAATERFGRLDIAVNNAGVVSPPKNLVDVTEEEMDLSFTVNTKGVFFGMKHQIKVMLGQAHGGSILNVASMAGLGGAPKLTAYCAAKHAVVGLTKTAAVEYGRMNIRVNAVCPFFSPTPMVTQSPMAGKVEKLAEMSPMNRMGSPEEMVNAMIGIIDPTNTYMNGLAIAVDGGVSAL